MAYDRYQTREHRSNQPQLVSNQPQYVSERQGYG